MNQEIVGLCMNCREIIGYNQNWELDERDGLIHNDCKVYQDVIAWIKLIEQILIDYYDNMAKGKGRSYKTREEVIKSILLGLAVWSMLK